MPKIKNAPQAKNCVIGTIFTPRITKTNCEKMAIKKSPPPNNPTPRWGGTDFGFNLGIPRLGGISRDSLHRGGFTPSFLFSRYPFTQLMICPLHRQSKNGDGRINLTWQKMPPTQRSLLRA